MRFWAVFICAFAVSVSTAPVVNQRPKSLSERAIPTSVYDDLVFYYRYASSAYNLACPRPNSNSLVVTLNSVSTDTQGFIVRDDARKEIVVVLRGSTSITDFLNDFNIVLTPFASAGVNSPSDVLVHSGALISWSSVASAVISSVRSQLASHPGYAIVTSGHSLGGTLSSLAGIALKENFPNVPLRLYTYGQFRTGNRAYANFVHSKVGPGNIFRCVHTTDIAPKSIPTSLGYAHHGTEYWTFVDPSSPATTKQCNPNGEDLTCSASNPFGDLPNHLIYYNIPASTPFCT